MITEKQITSLGNRIKAMGFPFYKGELEADLRRGDSDNVEVDCDNCDGRGYVNTTDDGGYDYENECSACDGTGIVECEGEEYSETFCHDYLMEKLSHLGLARYDSDNTVRLNKRGVSSHWIPIPPLMYFEFYYDGSVDSEATYTMATEGLKYSVAITEMFNDLADEIGNGLQIENAGFHIALLTSSDYPSRVRLPEDKIGNFRTEVTKLLPALFIACTSGDFTRELRFRAPQISTDNIDYGENKYSAIYTHGDTCLEYRLFETCYQRPEAIYEYFGVILKTLAYYNNPSKKVTPVGIAYQVYNDEGLLGFTKTPSQCEVLRKTLNLVRPNGYTLKQITDTRGVDLSPLAVMGRHASTIREKEQAYRDIVQRYETAMSQELIGSLLSDYENYKLSYPEQSDEYCKRRALRLAQPTTLREYINSNQQRAYATIMA